MNSRKAALNRAGRFRTCPPASIVKSEDHKEQARLHRSICPYCSRIEDRPDAGWDDAVSALAFYLNRPFRTREPSISTGRFRFIKPEYGFWKNGLYYTPPLMFTIEHLHTPQDHILAAQTFPETVLAGPGDLILDKSQTDLFPLFIEPWNMYPAPERCFSEPIGGPGRELIPVVKRLTDAPDALPDWAVRPRPMALHDPRIDFRELEKSVGSLFFSRISASPAKDPLNAHPAPAYKSVLELKNAILGLVPDLTWPVPADDYGAVLATARFPACGRVMAASDGDTEPFTANMVYLQNGAVVEFKPASGRILMRSSVNQGVGVTGRIGPAPFPESSFLIALLASGEADVSAPETTEWDPVEGRFYLFFRSTEISSERLAMAVLVQIP